MQCRQHSLQAYGPLELPLTAGLRLPELQALEEEVEEGEGEDEEGGKEQKRR